MQGFLESLECLKSASEDSLFSQLAQFFSRINALNKGEVTGAYQALSILEKVKFVAANMGTKNYLFKVKKALVHRMCVICSEVAKD
jgi:hypothetical protein